jgi:phosphoribosylamine-glycine ligase
MSQNQLAQISGIPQTTISAIENDRVRLGVERAKVLARALKCHPGVLVFHAGTALQDGQLVTSGGRVLSVVGRGTTITEATATAYRGVELVQFAGRQFRGDIGKGLA